MRTYATVRGTFWSRGSGKKLKGDHLGRELALYLMTCSQGTACGIFHIVLPTIAHEIGEPVEIIRDALSRIVEIAEYDEEAELCWVPNTAREQIGETLKPGDRRRVKLLKELEQFTGHPFVTAFVEKYAVPYGLTVDHLQLLNAPSNAPSDGVQRNAASPRTVLAQNSSDQVGGMGEPDQPEPEQPDRPVPCPKARDMFPATAVTELGKRLDVSEAAIKAAIDDYVGYFHVGGGMNERRKPYEWRKSCRQRLLNRHKAEGLPEPGPSKPKATPEAVAARLTAFEADDEAHRQRLRERAAAGVSGAVNVKDLTKGIG